MRFEFRPMSDWPPLAWLARCHKSRPVITVFHGSRVEAGDQWFCEAVWAGDYGAGDFDETDIVAGSGGRVRDGKVIFVSSGSTVDRLHSLEAGDDAWVSNSLPCLLAATGGSLDPSYAWYFRILMTVMRGIDRYERFLTTSAGRVQLTYFDNLVWDGKALTPQAKPSASRDFSSFSRYHDFLASSMQAMAANAADAGRKHPYGLIGTASAGYDSATVATLAKQSGCRHVICVERGNHVDSGEPLCEYLGLTPVVVRLNAWRSLALPEVPFMAADGHGGDVFFKSAEEHLSGKLLLTGFNGGKIWGKETTDFSPHMRRKDYSGLSLTEYRLAAGFVHCPVPFWGGRQIRDVVAISNSPEMKPWDIPGDYSRPICRRIVEEAGVPRELFGQKKRGSWSVAEKSNDFLTEQSMQDFLAWLGSVQKDWLRRGRIPPVRSLKVDRAERSCRNYIKRITQQRKGLQYSALRHSALLHIATVLGEHPTRLRKFVFAWALERAKEKYAAPLANASAG